MSRDSNKTLANANRSADKADSFIDSIARKLDGGVAEAQREINSVVTSRVREMLLNNLAKSGVKTQSGKLKNSLAMATVKVVLSGKPRFIIAMPSGVGDYSDKKGGGSFYKAAASVNYGSVRGGAKNARKKDKRAEKINARKAANKNGITGSVSTISGGTATKPTNYWELSQGQKNELTELIGSIFSSVVFR